MSDKKYQYIHLLRYAIASTSDLHSMVMHCKHAKEKWSWWWRKEEWMGDEQVRVRVCVWVSECNECSAKNVLHTNQMIHDPLNLPCTFLWMSYTPWHVVCCLQFQVERLFIPPKQEEEEKQWNIYIITFLISLFSYLFNHSKHRRIWKWRGCDWWQWYQCIILNEGMSFQI
jgi:hypothetical protein